MVKPPRRSRDDDAVEQFYVRFQNCQPRQTLDHPMEKVIRCWTSKTNVPSSLEFYRWQKDSPKEISITPGPIVKRIRQFLEYPPIGRRYSCIFTENNRSMEIINFYFPR